MDRGPQGLRMEYCIIYMAKDEVIFLLTCQLQIYRAETHTVKVSPATHLDWMNLT